MKKSCLIWGLMVMLCLHGRAQRMIQLNDNENYKLDSSVQYLMDTTWLTPTEVFGRFEEGRGKLLSVNYFGVPPKNNFCWLYLRLKNNNTAKSLIFRVKRHDIHRFEAFKKGKNSIDTLLISGDAFPFRQRSIPVGDMCFRVQIAPCEQAGLLILMDKRNEQLNSFFTLQKEDAFYRQIRQDYQAVFFYLGVVFFIFIFNLFLWVNLKDSIHLYYLLNLSAGAAVVAGNFGITLEYVWPNLTYQTSIIDTCFMILTLASNLLFMSKFLDLKSRSKFEPFVRCFAYFLLGWLVATLPVLWIKVVDLPRWLVTGYIYTILFYLIITILLIILVCIGEWRKKNPFVKIYSLGLSVMVLSSIIYELSILYNGFWIRPSDFIIWGNLLEISILAFGLTVRYNTYKQQNHSLLLEIAQIQNKLLTTQLHTQETERQRIAQDLHDELGGTLSALKAQMVQFNRNFNDTLHHSVAMVDEAIAELRAISHNLSPPNFDRQPLSKIILSAVGRLQSTQLEVLFIPFGREITLTTERKLNTYRILSELLNNVVKHAKATKVIIQLVYHDTYLYLSVEDNGVGFDTSKTSEGLGLKNLRERVSYLGGRWWVDSSERGSIFNVEIPLNAQV